MRDRLIVLVKESLMKHIDKSCLLAENIVDDLMANGVIVPPCKVGDTVYCFSHRPFNRSVISNEVYEAHVVRIVTNHFGTSLVIQIHNRYGVTEVPQITDFGKTVFLTREEAERALKGGEG